MMKMKIVIIILSRKNKRRRRKTPRKMKVMMMRNMMKRRTVKMNKKKRYRLRNSQLLRSPLPKTTRIHNHQRKKARRKLNRQIARNLKLRFWT